MATERAASPVHTAGRVVAVVLAAATVLLYARSLRSGFVYDAVAQLGEDDFVYDARNLFDVITFRVMARDVLDFNRPVQLLSLMGDALVWGRHPFGFHLTSVLLHAACVVLLFTLLRRWRARAGDTSWWPSAIAAALFAAHPLCTEAVAEPSYREELLACLFMLLALWLAERWTTTRARRDRLRAAGIVLCALLSIGAKETGVAVTPVLVAYWFAFRREDRRGSWALLLGACAAVSAMFTVARFALAPAHSAVFPQPATYLGGSLAQALQIQPRIWTLYLQHLLWPRGLSADYGPESLAHISSLLAAVVVLVLVSAQLAGAKCSPLLLMSAALFWATLLPASNLFPMYRPAADRYSYLPMTGVACAVAVLLARIFRLSDSPRRAALALSSLIIVVLGVSCVRRQSVFASDLALWTDTLRANPRSITATNNLGWAALDAGDLATAERLFARAIVLSNDRYADPHAGRALVLAAQQRADQATRALARAIELDPSYADPIALEKSMRLTRAQVARLRPLLSRRP